ncbi:MAG: hypothetical protein HYY49_10700 [Ignavibacteriales bacterium]|nr:hypothetical protein [Ignavibacteriales bacterium]
MNTRKLLFFLLGILVSLSSAFAQVQPAITKVNVPPASDRQPLSISVDLSRSSEIRKIVIWYRSFGESEFNELEMLLAGRSASVTLPAEVVIPPYIEYYIEATLESGPETYPLENPQANPLQISVKQSDPKDEEIRILTPEPGETSAAEDFVVAVSLYFASDNVDRTKTRIILDGVDVSKDAILSDDVVLYNPKNFNRPLNLGAHFLKVELRDSTGATYHSREITFNLSTATAIAEEKARLRAIGNGQLEFRNENLSTGGATYLRGDFRVDATYSILNGGASVHVDNQEKPDRQPQNRFLGYLETDFLRLQVGDAFPKFPSYIVSGKRVRGVSGNLMLGIFNVDASFGQTERFIEGTLADRDTIFADSSAVNARPRTSVHVGGSDTLAYYRYRLFNGGMYTRSFLAVRPSFGNGENYQLGFTYMKAKDDVGSIKYGFDPAPSENFVVGTDLLLAADDQRLKFETQASLTLTNTDISGGNFTDAEKDSIEASTGTKKAMLNLAEKIITVNENLFPTNPVGSGLPGLAGEAVLSLNYFNNFLRAVAYHRGAAYKSFGSEFLQTDLRGFQVSDYIRLFSNRVLTSLSFEQKSDNTANTKEVKTKFSNFNGSIAVNPGVNLPTFQLGYGQFGRAADNDSRTKEFLLKRNDPDSSSAKSADEKTSRYLVAASYDFVSGIRHLASVSFSLADRKDNTFKKQNQQNMFIQTSVTSNFTTMPLQTIVSILYSKNTNDVQTFYTDSVKLNQDSALTKTDFNYTMVTLGGTLRMLNDDLRLAASISPAFGAFNRVNFQFGAEYTYALRHNFLFQADYIQNAGIGDDTIISLIYRFNF